MYYYARNRQIAKKYSTGEKLMKFNVNPNNMDSSNLCQAVWTSL